MENIDEILQELTSKTFEPGSTIWVDVTHINNPHSFYVRPYDHRPYLKKIEIPGDLMNEQDIQPHTVVVYLSKLLKNMVRGIISNVDSSNRTCVLWALDYGVMDMNIPFDVLHKPKLDIAIMGLALHCRLHHCAPIQGNNWTEITIQAMKAYIGNAKANMLIKAKMADQLSVEIYSYCPDGLSKLLALTGYSTLGYIPFTTPKRRPNSGSGDLQYDDTTLWKDVTES